MAFLVERNDIYWDSANAKKIYQVLAYILTNTYIRDTG